MRRVLLLACLVAACRQYRLKYQALFNAYIEEQNSARMDTL